MSPLAILGRIFFAILFVYAGVDKLMDIPATTQIIAGKIIPALPAALTTYSTQLEAAVGMPTERILAILAGVLEILGGLSIALNFGARIFAILLIIFIAIVTYYFHDFWNMTDANKTLNIYSALKNLSLIGGLLIIASYPSPVLADNNYTGSTEPKY